MLSVPTSQERKIAPWPEGPGTDLADIRAQGVPSRRRLEKISGEMNRMRFIVAFAGQILR